MRDPVAMELSAGYLLIFDADGFHRGGSKDVSDESFGRTPTQLAVVIVTRSSRPADGCAPP